VAPLSKGGRLLFSLIFWMIYLRITTIIILLLIIAGSCNLTGPETGTVHGRVMYGDGSPIDNATVTATRSSSGTSYSSSGSSYTATTDSEGNYRIPGLPVGTYTVTATKDEEKRSKVVYIKDTSLSCESSDEQVDFTLGSSSGTDIKLSDPYVSPSTVSASSDTTVLFGVRVDGKPDSVSVSVGSSLLLGLNDSGSNGDTVAGDGIYSGSVSSKSLTPGEYDCKFRAVKNGKEVTATVKLEVTS